MTDGDSSSKHFLLNLLAGSVLTWLAFPPLGWSLLVWVGPIFWLRWIRVEQLPGKRPYRTIWLAGILFWLLAVHWIRLPHPMNYIGWLALAGYLGAYLPLFVALARAGVHRCRLPMCLAIPVAWTGLEWLRGHLFTGFLMGSLAHTQIENLKLIQIASLVGEYGVTFLIMLVASCFTRLVFEFKTEKEYKLAYHVAVILIAFGTTYYYGKLQGVKLAIENKVPMGPRIALVQGNTLADWKMDPQKQNLIMEEHLMLSFDAVAKSGDQKVDLVIWPETAFRNSFVTMDEGTKLDETISTEQIKAGKEYLETFVRQIKTAVLVGIEHVNLFNDSEGGVEFDIYNSAVFVNEDGTFQGPYDKMHRVVLGEYVPFSDWFPFLKNLTPITGAIQPGKGPVAMEHNGVIYAPNICYESVVPHLIRQHVCDLTVAGKTPQVLVNLTNDAWFWGSSELDMHLACGVFRAIETRTPMVIAANGGLSAYVDSYGKVQQKTPRQQSTSLLVDLKLPQHKQTYPSAYVASGDWFAISCVVCCMVLAVAAWRSLRNPAP